MGSEKRGSIAFFPTYRPPVALDIYSCPMDPPPASDEDELQYMTHSDADHPYNYNAQVIPPPALKKLLKRPLFSTYKEADVDSGRLSGLIFVSERGEVQLETLHIALRCNSDPKVKVFSLADVFGTAEFKGVRMEDSGCFAGDYLIYITTRDPAPKRRQPWTAVYRTHLITGQTQRLTPPGVADLSPSVSPSGKMIAVASFEKKEGGWDGEIENLKTDILVMSVEEPSKRVLVVKDGGWPTWGSDNVIFFHRKVDNKVWRVFRADNIRNSLTSSNSANIVKIDCVVPDDPKADEIDARTPAAISETKVAVATIRQGANINDIIKYKQRVIEQYRHIEIFEYATSGTKKKPAIKLTQNTRPKADHYNPFVIDDVGRKKRIGYHRCKSDTLKSGDDIPRQFHKLGSPFPEVGAFRVSGVFPTFSTDGSKLAFVDNEFKAVWVADDKGLRVVHRTKVNNFFSPVWNQNSEMDTLYVCEGPAFSAKESLHICAIKNVSAARQQRKTLTKVANNAFPSSNPDGTKLVFRSTRDYHGHAKRHKNLYIMEDANLGEYGDSDEPVRRLTNGEWTDTHCQWSPRGDWIVYSSTERKPPGSPDDDNGLDPGYFAVFLVKWNDPKVRVRVLASGDNLAGHVNHPFFSPDGQSIVVTADLAAVSVDPVSMPLFVHSVRPYGDIFTVDIDSKDIENNKDVKKFTRITHSRYEYSTASWTKFSTTNPKAKWNLQLSDKSYTPTCPYAHTDGGESWHMTGHLCLGAKRCC